MFQQISAHQKKCPWCLSCASLCIYVLLEIWIFLGSVKIASRSQTFLVLGSTVYWRLCRDMSSGSLAIARHRIPKKSPENVFWKVVAQNHAVICSYWLFGFFLEFHQCHSLRSANLRLFSQSPDRRQFLWRSHVQVHRRVYEKTYHNTNSYNASNKKKKTSFGCSQPVGLGMTTFERLLTL